MFIKYVIHTRMRVKRLLRRLLLLLFASHSDMGETQGLAYTNTTNINWIFFFLF